MIKHALVWLESKHLPTDNQNITDEANTVTTTELTIQAPRRLNFEDETDSNVSEMTVMDEEASFAQSQRAMYDQNNRDRGGQLNYRDQHYEHCPICNYNNYAYCEVPCRNSLIFPDDCPKALIVYLPRRDYHYAYRLEVIFEEGAQRNRFYEILRNGT